MAVEISRSLLDGILAEAAADPKREICGLLLGDGDRIAEARATANLADDPARSFEIDPVALLAAHRIARDGGPRVIGCYHSHPSGASQPSPRDAAAAVPTPGFLWLIVANGSAALFRERRGGALHDAFDPAALVVGSG